MSDCWNALFMSTWMCTTHYTSNQTFPDTLHFQGILSFNKICNRQFKSHRHSYLKHPFPWPWQMQSCLVRLFQNATLTIIFPACCFDLGTPPFCAQLALHLPHQTKLISLPGHFRTFFHLSVIHYQDIIFHLWLNKILTFTVVCCTFKETPFCTWFQVVLYIWETLFRVRKTLISFHLSPCLIIFMPPAYIVSVFCSSCSGKFWPRSVLEHDKSIWVIQ